MTNSSPQRFVLSFVALVLTAPGCGQDTNTAPMLDGGQPAADLGAGRPDLAVTDQGTDGAVDVGPDGADAGSDGGVDAGSDGGVDAGVDAGLDGGVSRRVRPWP